MRQMSDADTRLNAATRAPRARRRLKSAQDVRDHRRRILTWLLSAGLGVLLVNAIVGENGYLATVGADQEKRRIEAALARVRLQNEALLEESRRLRSDPDALEEAARRGLSLMKPGETLVIVRPAPAAAPVSK